MILTLKNVGKIKEAEIKLDDITVIAGYNSTGKSTVSKSLYGLVLPFCDMNTKIKYEKQKSIRFLLSEYLDKHSFSFNYLQSIMNVLNEITEKDSIYPKSIPINTFEDALSNYLKQNDFFIFQEVDENVEIDHNEFLSHAKDLCLVINDVLKKDDMSFFARIQSLTLLNLFNKQVVTKTEIPDTKAIFNLKISDNNAFSVFINEFETEFKTKNKPHLNNNIVYIETSNVIDDLNKKRTLSRRNMSNPYENNLIALLKRDPENETELSEEEQEERSSILKTFQNIFEETLHGELARNDGNFFFKEFESDELIDMKNVSSGMKCLLVIQRLIQNGTINKNTILIIDEPETNLHPEWQILFANILVLLNKLLGIKILINSHSPYFIRALEVKMAMNEMADKGNYYLMMSCDNGLFMPKDVTNSTEEIYRYLYKPLESLTL